MRSAGKTFKKFMICLRWAKEGKSFIYYHPDFVAMDGKTFRKMQKKMAHPVPVAAIMEEEQSWDPKVQEALNNYFGASKSDVTATN